MRDGITLAKAGHPVVVFVHDRFEQAARAQAAALGLAELPIHVYAQYDAADPERMEAQKAAQAAKAFQQLLG